MAWNPRMESQDCLPQRKNPKPQNRPGSYYAAREAERIGSVATSPPYAMNATIDDVGCVFVAEYTPERSDGVKGAPARVETRPIVAETSLDQQVRA
eukprot:2290155-Pyramimonas_sp.AAC.1